jgi:hypothetical protein
MPKNKKTPAKPAKSANTTPPAKGKSKHSSKKVVEEEEEEDVVEKGTALLASYECPGERTRIITEDQLRKWGKTSNCKFYISDIHKNEEFTLSNDDNDRVCFLF